MLARTLAIAIAFSLGAIGAAPAAMVTENDYLRLVALHSPVISPDGKLASVVVSSAVSDEDRSRNDLVLIDLSTRTRRTLVPDRKGLADPAFSPDGAKRGFLANAGTGDDAKAQVFIMGAQDDRPVQATHAGSDVRAFSWRPDGQAIAYAAEDAQPQRSGAERFRNSFIFTTEPITARSPARPSHLFVVNLSDGETLQLTFGPQSVADDSTISWSPDGATIAYTRCRNAILNDQSYSQIALVDVAARRVRALTERTMWEDGALFAPDGTHLVYAYSKGDPQVNLTQLYLTRPSGGRGSVLSGTIDRPIGDAAWLPDSKGLIVAAPDRTTNALYRLTLEGRAQRIDLGAVVPGIPLSTTGGADVPSLVHAIARDGTLLFVGSSTAQPPELFTYSSSAGVAKVTDFNAAIAQFDWATAQRLTFPTSTGVIADAVLYRPQHFTRGRRYPVVVYIHGGPDDPSMLIFDFWAQVMALRGWLVLRPNYRGTPNLGLKYQRAILYDPEDGPGKDIIAALDAVRARGIVDTTRMAVSGWSYGGIMTAWMISKYHIWKAAVSGASVNDWIADYGTADDSLADVDLFHGSPFVGTNAAEWRRASAITYAHDVTTPVLILSDVGDNRDPFATSAMYWRALRDNGKDATLRVWPIAGHFPNDPVRVVDVYHYWIEFIAGHFR